MTEIKQLVFLPEPSRKFKNPQPDDLFKPMTDEELSKNSAIIEHCNEAIVRYWHYPQSLYMYQNINSPGYSSMLTDCISNLRRVASLLEDPRSEICMFTHIMDIAHCQRVYDELEFMRAASETIYNTNWLSGIHTVFTYNLTRCRDLFVLKKYPLTSKKLKTFYPPYSVVYFHKECEEFPGVFNIAHK
jgi:hypothetical protein